MTFIEAIERLDRTEAFESTVASMNALLIAKGVYSPEEYEGYFVESAKAKIKKKEKSNAESK